MQFNWQLKYWPEFRYDLSKIESFIQPVTEKSGIMKGLFLSEETGGQHEMVVELLTSEALNSSVIEGEVYSRQDIRSSIQNNLFNLNKKHLVRDKNASGIASIMSDIISDSEKELNEAKIKQWHFWLFEHSNRIHKGEWRSGTEKMQIISGNFTNETVHFEAPPSSVVPSEMKHFFHWLKSFKADSVEKIIAKAALAHLYFESIHPFEDGNGRIGRAVSEHILYHGFDLPAVISISSVISAEKKAYYDALKSNQKSLDVDGWINYFTQLTLVAFEKAIQTVHFTIKKGNFLHKIQHQINERQKKTLIKMLSDGFQSFEGGMSAKKYQSINKVSKATATRDLQDLFDKGILNRYGSGRSVRYEINFNY